jgi:hypothetical protein
MEAKEKSLMMKASDHRHKKKVRKGEESHRKKRRRIALYNDRITLYNDQLKLQTGMLDNLKSLYGEESEKYLSFMNKIKESSTVRENQVIKLLTGPNTDSSSGDSSDTDDGKEPLDNECE